MLIEDEIILHIRSKDCEKILQGTFNSSILINLPTQIIIPELSHLAVKLISAEIPYSFYNISDNLDNNKLTYDTTEIINLYNSNYSMTELIRYLNSLTEQPFTFSYNKYDSKITITNNDDYSHIINFGIGNCHKILGNKPNNISFNPQQSIILDAIADLCSIHALYVKSNITGGNVISTNSSNSTILQKIPINHNSGNLIYLDTMTYLTTSIIKSGVISSFIINIEDQNHNPINFNLVEYELSISFRFVENTRHFKNQIQHTSTETKKEKTEIKKENEIEKEVLKEELTEDEINMNNLIIRLKEENDIE